jgi:LysM repeat protein
MIRLRSLLAEGSILKVGAITRGVAVANKLKTKLGLKSFQAAAIVGNFVEESGVRPDAQQDMKGTGNYIPGPLKIDGRTGYSFAQWTEKGRQKSLKAYADSRGIDITAEPLTNAIATDFVIDEFNGAFANVLERLKASKTLSAATNIILKQYEMPYNQGASALAARTANAQAILDVMPKDTPNTAKKPAAKPTPPATKSGLQGTLDYINQEFDKNNAAISAKTTSTTTPTTFYVVRSGDTLSGIATKYKTTVPSIKKLNKLTTDSIKPGQKLKVK